MVRLQMESTGFCLYHLMLFVMRVLKYVKKTPVTSTC